MKANAIMKLVLTIVMVGLSLAVMADKVATHKEEKVPNPIHEDVFVRWLHHANAMDVKAYIETLVAESQKDVQKDRKTGRADADPGMICGKVIVIADKRTNRLIVVTSRSNMNLFDRLIEALDIDMSPDMRMTALHLKYADAEDVAQTIKELFCEPGVVPKFNVKVRADKRTNSIVVLASSLDMIFIDRLLDELDFKFEVPDKGGTMASGTDSAADAVRGKVNKVAEQGDARVRLRFGRGCQSRQETIRGFWAWHS